MFKMVPTHDYLTVSGVTLGFAHQNNDLLLKFQLRFSRISLASNSGCRTQCHSGDTTGTTTTFVFSLPNSKERLQIWAFCVKVSCAKGMTKRYIFLKRTIFYSLYYLSYFGPKQSLNFVTYHL